MYTIFITEDNELNAHVRERIMQRSKLVDNLHFLTAPLYKGQDMSKYTVMMEYFKPVSKQYKSELLTRSKDLYENCIEYILPLDTEVTSEPGSVEIQLTFTYIEMDEDGAVIQRVRKTSPGELKITPIAAWSDFIPDEALSALDQRLLYLLARQQHLEDLQNAYMEEKADDISYENNVLQLLANGKKIGSKHEIASGQSSNDVIEFDPKTTSRMSKMLDTNNKYNTSYKKSNLTNNPVSSGDVNVSSENIKTILF